MIPAERTQVQVERSNNRLLLILGVIAIGMMLFFLFGFRSIYTLWCSVTGTGMRPNNTAITAAAPVATGRMLAVRFESKVFDGLPVRFTAEKSTDRIEVGTDATNTYQLTNLSDQPIHLRPIHQVSPINATTQFAMRICL